MQSRHGSPESTTIDHNEIEGMLAEEDSAGDAWASVEVPSSFILDSDYARGEAWTYLRSQLREEFGKGEA